MACHKAEQPIGKLQGELNRGASTVLACALMVLAPPAHTLSVQLSVYVLVHVGIQT